MKFVNISKDFAFPTKDSKSICGLITYVPQKIDWGTKNWALACEFIGNELEEIKSASDKCGPLCKKKKIVLIILGLIIKVVLV